MTKKHLSLLLVFCMVLSALFTTASAAESTYEYSRIAYYMGGEEVDTLTAGELTAKVKVKSQDSTDSLYFASILYKNNKIVAAGADTTPEALSNSAVTYETTLTIPDGLKDAKLITVLWNNLKDMKPVCTASIVPSSDARLLMLSADGVEVDGFSPDVFEYTMPVSADQINAPYIRYKAADNGAKVTITDAKRFPGESIVEVTAPDGTTNTYTITYECDEELLVSMKRNFTISDRDGQCYKYRDDLQVNKPMFENRDGAVSHVDESLQGLDYISVGIGAPDNGTITLVTKRGATFHALMRTIDNKDGNKYFPSSDGWVMDDIGWDRYIENNWNKIEDPNGEYLHEDGKTYKYAPIGEIGDGLNLFEPNDTSVPESALGGPYDLNTQGWIYWDYRKANGQKHRGHKYCAFSEKYSKHFDANYNEENEEEVLHDITISEGANSTGVPIIIEWDEYIPNDYSELSL